MANSFVSTVTALLLWWTGFYAVVLWKTYKLIVCMVDKNYKLKWNFKKLKVVYDSENLSLLPKVYFKIFIEKSLSKEWIISLIKINTRT